jgi:hypothetical protein
MRSVAAVAAAFVDSGIGLCLAQAAAAQTVAPAAASGANVDPKKLELAREVFTENGGADAYKTQMRALFSGISQMTKANLPAGNEALADALMKDIADAEIELIPQIVNLSAEVYAENLDEAELRDLLAWSRSPSARSIRAKMPGVTQQLLGRMGPLVQALMPTIMQKTLDRACEQTKCTPETRKLVAEAMEKALRPKGS